MKGGWKADIGIECHVQLKTASKLFCGCGNDAREAAPNTLVCPVCLGLPGTLPVLNKRAVELAVQAGLALEAEIAHETKFDRKNYFYPDLPKGYQITQFDQPVVGRGMLEVPHAGKSFKVGITRAHLEEDAGKLTHPEGADYSLVDLNRAGTPLLEIVSEPDMHSPQEAKAYASELYQRMRYAKVSDVDLYHGNMRFDLNISVRRENDQNLGIRTEIKNLNSFRNIERAAEYEIDRQISLLEKGETITQETRGWDETKTYSMRSKEEAADYRYFPEPDLPPLTITPEFIATLERSLPLLVTQAREELSEIGVTGSTQAALLNYPGLVEKLFLERDMADATNAQLGHIANWFANIVIAEFSTQDSATLDNPHNYFDHPGELTRLAQMVEDKQMSSTGVKELLITYWSDFKDIEARAQADGLLQVSDTNEIAEIVDQVIADNPKAAQDVRNGEMRAIGFLVGQVMKASQGQANPQLTQQLIKEKLDGGNN